jgi:hypothetical protein
MTRPSTLTTRAIVVFWLPLAATWLMMAAEGPYVSAIVARLGEPTYNLAAYGVAFSLAWLAESPIMMLLTAATALVDGRQSFLALRRFTFLLNGVVTALMAACVLPPVFGLLADRLMNLPPDIARLAHLATLVLIPWPAAIGYRRFYQGVLVRHHLTRRVAYGTVIRLASMSVTAAALATWSKLPGAVVGTMALTSGVLAEAAASRWMARHLVRTLLAEGETARGTPLSLREIARFYAPLAMTSAISMAAGPLVTIFLGHGRAPVESLAVWPVIGSFVFLLRSGGVAYQEVAVALSGARHEHAREVAAASSRLGAAITVVAAAVLFSPLADVWFHRIVGLPQDLASFALLPARVLVLLPALEYLLSFQRARWIIDRRTGVVTAATAIEALGLGAALFAGVVLLGWTGALAAGVALTAGRLAANAYLGMAARAVDATG